MGEASPTSWTHTADINRHKPEAKSFYWQNKLPPAGVSLLRLKCFIKSCSNVRLQCLWIKCLEFVLANMLSRLFTSYNVALILKLPRQTHRYMLEPLSEAPHLYVQLLSRYVTFVQTLLNCNIFEVRFLASLSIHDMRTVMGTVLIS